MRLCLAWDNMGQAPADWASHIAVTWDSFEPAYGKFRFDLFDKALARAYPRPCYLQLPFSMYDKAQGIPLDRTPGHSKTSLTLAAGGKVGTIPDYSPFWVEAYSQVVAALAKHYKGNPQIAGYWHSAGWNQETTAAVNNAGGKWADAARPLLREDTYISSIITTTKAAVEAWQPVTVYLPGAPSPGSVWGRRRREVIAECLAAGAGYMNCGLLSDNDTSFGVGERQGQGMYDIALGVPHVGFEEGPRRASGNSMEVYWMLLRALAWDADFVNVYWSLSAQHAAAVTGLLPKPGTRWIVFRDREYPELRFESGGKTYGYGGEPGCWASGIMPHEPVDPDFFPDEWGFGRWVVEGAPRLRLLEWPGGRAAVKCWWADSGTQDLICDVVDGIVQLPPGAYHRVDVEAAPLTLEERVAGLERRVAVLEGKP